MKKYIKFNSGKQTLRNYIDANKQKLADCKIIIYCEEPYNPEDPDDCPGVLFDGNLQELLDTRDQIEDNTSRDNFLTQSDMDTATVAIADYSGNTAEIGLENLV